jgi:NADH dehydrogenase
MYKELLAEIAARLGKRPLLVSVPFTLWHLLARIPGAPISRNQVELMETDTVASPEMPGFHAFGITPQPIAHTLEKILVAA